MPVPLSFKVRKSTSPHATGMSRVDFFLTENMSFLINKVNTIPGFTDIGMYAKAMAASGVSYPDVIDRLVEHGLARAGL